MKKTIILPRSSWGIADVKEMVEFKWVLYMLIFRDIKLRYKQTLLGVLWVVIQPLITALLLSFVFGKWMKVDSEGVPYILFAFCGLIPWFVFSQSVQRASTSLINETQLIQKVYFPRLFLPVAGTLGVLLDYFISLASLFVLMIFYNYKPSYQLLFLPFGIVHIFAFSMAFNIALSSLSAHYRDFKHIVPFVLQFWMYASPLAYSIQSIPEKWHWLFALNPLTGIIEFYRWSLLGHSSFPFTPFYVSCFSTIVLLCTSVLVFRKLEWTLSDVI